MARTFSTSVVHVRTLALILLAAILVGGPLSAVTALAQQTPAQADATLRFVHGSPGAPNVDVLLDGLPILEDLPFGTVTGHVSFTPGTHRFQIVSADQPPDAALVDETVDVAPGSAYILGLYGRLNDIGGDLYPVDLSEIEPGEVRVRLINLGVDTGDIDLLETGGDEWFGNIALGDASSYRTLSEGTYTTDLRSEDDRVLQTLTNLTFDDTRVYNLVVVGQVYDNSLTLQALETRVTPPCTRVLELPGDASDSCIRFVHAAPDAPPMDAYVNDALIGEDLTYARATTSVAVPSGDNRMVHIVTTGAAVEDTGIDAQYGFEPGQAYVVLVTGAGDELNLMITGTDLRPVPTDQARLRVINASPDVGTIDVGMRPVPTLFEGVNLGEATNYVVVDAGTYPIEIRPAGDEQMVEVRTDAVIAEGMSYDLVVIGRPADRSLRFLALRAPLGIRTGFTATPVVVTNDAALSVTVVPSDIGTEVTPTPVP